MTEVDDRNFTPEGISNKRWKELEAAKKKQEQSRQNSDGSRNGEQKFAHLFAAANEKIDKLTSDANQKKDGIDADLKKSIKEVVQDLASNLKALGFPVNRIANEIVHQLKGKASRSWILEILPDEYKDKSHQESAQRKQKVPPVQQDNSGQIAPLAERQSGKATTSNQVTPQQERKQLLMVGTDGHEIIDTDSRDSPTDLPSEQAIAVKDSEDSAVKGSPQPQPQQPQQLRILIDWDDLSDKMTELHYKDIKNFWLCGRIENGKLLDIVLERSQPQPSSPDGDHQMKVVV